MLTRFKINKFRGFSEELCWDLSHPSNYEYNPYAIKNGVIKNGIIFGPNGCGKSNLSKAIFDIVYHLTQKQQLVNFYQNYIYAGAQNELVDFEYTFKFGNTILVYAYSKDARGILVKESLIIDGALLFAKESNKLDYESNSIFANLPKDKREALSSNANNVSIVGFLISFYPFEANHPLIQLSNFVNGMLWFVNLDYRGYMGLETGTTSLQEFIIKENLTSKLEVFLKNISDQEYHFATPQKDDTVLYCYFGNKTVPFFNIASTGTNALTLLFFWIQKLGKASFVMIDEFDAFYHFDLSFKICKELFKLDCQLFTTSHNTSLMSNDLLRPDCFFILNNNKIHPFHECTDKELRFAHNLEKMYRGGALEIRQ